MNGEGSVYLRTSDNRWVGAVTIGYTASGTMRRKTVTAKTKTEVLARCGLCGDLARRRASTLGVT